MVRFSSRKKRGLAQRGAVVERLPLEQQEPTGPALQCCNGGFQESDFQRDYLKLEGLCLHLEDTESPQGGEAYICVPNIDKTSAVLKTLPPPSSPEFLRSIQARMCLGQNRKWLPRPIKAHRQLSVSNKGQREEKQRGYNSWLAGVCSSLLIGRHCTAVENS